MIRVELHIIYGIILLSIVIFIPLWGLIKALKLYGFFDEVKE